MRVSEAPNIQIGDEPEYVSYSAFTQWLKCGKAYQLSRLLEVRELPAWYFVGGTAFHKAAEDYDLARWEAGIA
jgi:hypothetical protein